VGKDHDTIWRIAMVDLVAHYFEHGYSDKDRGFPETLLNDYERISILHQHFVADVDAAIIMVTVQQVLTFSFSL
jgi:hypothetical protein